MPSPQRKETPEEYVRQEIAKTLVREYDYEKQEISVEFTLRLGSRHEAEIGVITDRNQPAALTMHALFSHVPQTTPFSAGKQTGISLAAAPGRLFRAFPQG